VATEAQPIRAYRALLVDYGGVMTTSMTVSFAAFCAATGVDPSRLKDVLAAAYATAGEAGVSSGDVHDLVRGVETGRLDPEEFDRDLAAALSGGLPEPVPAEGLTSRLFAELRPDQRMRGAVRIARERGLVTGLISNTWGLSPPEDIDGLFDVVVLSGREGLRKPEPEIYRLAARRAGVAPAESVFVDDIPTNVEGARAVGMAGVLHRDAAITLPKLEALLGFRLSE
jgi:putative hydrolase of the HAD superfamily